MLPAVNYGAGDALEHYMGDYLVGMFDDARPLSLQPVAERTVTHVHAWRGMEVMLVRLPAGGSMVAIEPVDVVELDLVAPVARSVAGVPAPAAEHVGAQAVRVAAFQACQRVAGPHGGAWLQFRGAAA